MSDAMKADVVAEARRVAELALAHGRRFDACRIRLNGWLIRDVEDRRYTSGDLYVDRLGNDWKDFHNRFGQIWLGEDGTLHRVDEAYGESAEIGRFDNSGGRTATNEDLMGDDEDFGQIMKELRRLALIVE